MNQGSILWLQQEDLFIWASFLDDRTERSLLDSYDPDIDHDCIVSGP